MSRDRFLTGLLLVAGIGGLLPLGATFWWLFELTSHFRIQYLIVALPLMLLAIIRRKAPLAVLMAATILVNAQPLVAYLPTATDPEFDFRIDVLNINVNSENLGHAAIADSIGSSDAALVAVLELTPALDQSLQLLAQQYPHRFSAPGDGSYGIGILSRYPVIKATEIPIGPATVIDALIELPTGQIRFIAAHLYPPIGPRMARTRNAQLDQLAAYAATIDQPTLLCGDFNLTPYSPLFQRFTKAADLRDVRRGHGTGFSWPSFFPLAGIPIDHCLVRGPLVVSSVTRLERFGSDHYPVKVSLGWQGKE